MKGDYYINKQLFKCLDLNKKDRIRKELNAPNFTDNQFFKFIVAKNLYLNFEKSLNKFL